MNAEERRDVMRQEMADLSWDFLSFYGEYYNGKGDDEELLEMATQPFWQSMRLSKKRLDSKGLTMDVELSDDSSRSAVADGRVHMSKDGTDLIGTSARRVLAKRRFLKDNKEIYAKREHEISAISLLKADIEGDTVACPNCGHVGTVQSYIDGCDACGARFTVKDFATKISAFSLEENMEKKLKKTTLHTVIVLAILTGLLMLFGAICFGIVAVKLMTGQNNAGIISSVVGFAMALDLVSVGIRCMILLPVVYIFLLVVVISRYRKRFIGTDIIKAVLPDFSAEDFCQNLEYKLRNIHMTDKASEVAVFAHCPLEKVIERYRDVVDGAMTRCYFKAIQVVDGGYIIDAEVIMRLTQYNGKRIRTRYEKLSLSLFGRKEVIQKKTAALREYK